MAAKPGDGPARRLGALLALAGLPAVAAGLLLGVQAYREGRAGFLAALEVRAREHGRVLEALLDGPLDAEASGEPEPRDTAGSLERARSLVATLDGPAGTIRLLPAEGASDIGPIDGSAGAFVWRRPIGRSGFLLEHRVEAGAPDRAGLAAAAPWLFATAALAASTAVAYLLIRRRVLAPALAALDGLVAAADGRPLAGDGGEGWARPWLEEGVRAARARAERLAAAEAAEAPLAAALEALEEGVALVAADGRLRLVNTAFARALAGSGAGRPTIGRPLEPGMRAALARLAGVRELALASGDRLILLPAVADAVAGNEAPARPEAPSAGPLVGPRLASMIQELAEALAQVARQAVLLHELSGEPAVRARAEQLRRAAERCTRAIAPLLAPPRPPRPTAVAVDRLLEPRLERLRRAGVEVVAGIAPNLPPVVADPDRLADLLDGLVTTLLPSLETEGPIRLRLRLRRGGAGLRLELERPAAREEAGRPPGLALLEHRARELGAALAWDTGPEGGRLLRLDLPLEAARPAEPAPGRLLVVEGGRGAARGLPAG